MKMGKSEIKILIIYIGRQNMRYQQLSVVSDMFLLYNFLQFFSYEF